MAEIIAEGTALQELGGYDLYSKELRLYFDHDVTRGEALSIEEKLSSELSGPVSYGGNAMVIRFAQAPSGYSLWPLVILIPLMAIGGFLGWQLVKPSGSLENLLKTPLLIVAGGFAIAMVVWAAWGSSPSTAVKTPYGSILERK